MDRDEIELEKLEQICREVISGVLLTCESKLIKHGGEIKGLPSAAMAVRESILTFLALISLE